MVLLDKALIMDAMMGKETISSTSEDFSSLRSCSYEGEGLRTLFFPLVATT